MMIPYPGYQDALQASPEEHLFRDRGGKSYHPKIYQEIGYAFAGKECAGKLFRIFFHGEEDLRQRQLSIQIRHPGNKRKGREYAQQGEDRRW